MQSVPGGSVPARASGSIPGPAAAVDVVQALAIAPIPITRFHVVMLSLAVFLGLIFAMPNLSHFDPASQRPLTSMDPFIKHLARVTNVPIKLGAVHLCLYLIEFIKDPVLFRRHVGQRLTTLWWQMLQNHRLGQHFQMQIETCMQIADVLTRRSEARYNVGHCVVFAGISILIFCQAALTSLGWHNFNEQFAGFSLAMVKLLFDYSVQGTKLNDAVGGLLSIALHWVGGAFLVLLGHVYSDFGALVVFFPLLFARYVFRKLIVQRVGGEKNTRTLSIQR